MSFGWALRRPLVARPVRAPVWRESGLGLPTRRPSQSSPEAAPKSMRPALLPYLPNGSIAPCLGGPSGHPAGRSRPNRHQKSSRRREGSPPPIALPRAVHGKAFRLAERPQHRDRIGGEGRTARGLPRRGLRQDSPLTNEDRHCRGPHGLLQAFRGVAPEALPEWSCPDRTLPRRTARGGSAVRCAGTAEEVSLAVRAKPSRGLQVP